MPTGRVAELSGFWTDWALMNLDKGVRGVGAEDGYLSTEELSYQLLELGRQRDARVSAGKSTTYIDEKINDGRNLYKDMTDHDVTRLKYLPDTLLDLSLGARQRACELLRLDDTTATGEIDQYCIDHARACYQQMHPSSPVALTSKTAALNQIAEIARALGLS